VFASKPKPDWIAACSREEESFNNVGVGRGSGMAPGLGKGSGMAPGLGSGSGMADGFCGVVLCGDEGVASLDPTGRFIPEIQQSLDFALGISLFSQHLALDP